ncbi:hypothetical protein KM427_08375 [Nocardioides sp. LMS-CY]|uniref:DUF5719 family protein n=1 Tax=Nocardioides sp. (strain LMS-CY) TaxID=2840457 RepID=UPI001BFFF1BD|nr:DUF5719 family protein [Nocardioides sp. LMS-CY]QWF23695.1 hypothetical protein KM427_08375 [Nocardioides sp. LMS-CY]
MTQPRTTGGRRRTATRRGRLNLTMVLAVVLPLLSVAALLLVRPAEPAATTRPPERTTLTTATLVCPAGLPGAPELALTTVSDDVDGSVRVGLGKDAKDAGLVSGRVTTTRAPDAVAVTGEDDSAPGLVAGRGGGDEPAVTACLPPAAGQWFTGVGAGASHRSVLELTNPDGGTAVADVTVLGRNGVVEAPRLRGVSVPGGSSVRLDLATLVPRTDELALEVVTARGRLGVALLDRFDRPGRAPLTQDWLPAQPAPATSNLLLGLAPGTGQRTLAIANPGDDEVRAEVKVVDSESVFAPDGAEEIRVPPRGVARVRVSSIVNAAVGQDALGLQVTSSGPVSAALRSVVGNDLSFATAGSSFDAEATVLVPKQPAEGRGAARRRVVLAGATTAGTVTVVALDANGDRLRRRTAEVVPDRGTVVKVPPTARLISVLPERTSVTGAVLTSSANGASMLPLTVPVRNGLVPDVRPGLP